MVRGFFPRSGAGVPPLLIVGLLCLSVLSASLSGCASAAEHVNRGLFYSLDGDLDRAIEQYDKAIRLNPAYALAYRNRGDAYYEKGDDFRAIEDYNQAIRLDPTYASAYSNRGEAYEKKGDNDRATEDFKQADRLNGAGIFMIHQDR